jgi:D-inositol-3-phosphate glycosyltransferase
MVGDTSFMPGSPLLIALISEHASPLAEDIGSANSGGQNVYVRALAEAQAARGHQVTIYTRRTAARQPTRVALAPGIDIVHVPAGPARELPKEDLAPFMGDFGDHLALAWREQPPDIVHAHYWMSGVAALAGTRRTPIPVVATFHALALERLRYHPFRPDTTGPPSQENFLRERERERERERGPNVRSRRQRTRSSP